MKNALDEVFIRENSHKWKNKKYDDMLSFDIADMDFKLSNDLLEYIHKRIVEGIFGYEYEGEEYYGAFCYWLEKYHNLDIEKEWVVPVSGAIFGLKIAIEAFSKEGEGVLLHLPGYNAYFDAINNNKRKMVFTELKSREDGYYMNSSENNKYDYYMDYEDFENKIVNENVKLFIFCNPHNPTGKVWTDKEIRRIIEICKKYLVCIVSDEVFDDFIFEGVAYNSVVRYMNLYEKMIVIKSPCKTFNVASLHTANAIIANGETRHIFFEGKKRRGYMSCNSIGITMSQVLYRHGRQWFEEVYSYIEGNKKIINKFFVQRYPSIKVVNSKSLYMLWIDMRYLQLSDQQLEKLFIDEMHMCVAPGSRFWGKNTGFIRFNVACSSSLIKEALSRMDRVLKNGL